MSYIEVAPGTTFCPNTPENRRQFNRLKAQLQRPSGGGGTALQQQIAKENKWLKSCRAFLPGHGPNR